MMETSEATLTKAQCETTEVKATEVCTKAPEKANDDFEPPYCLETELLHALLDEGFVDKAYYDQHIRLIKPRW